MADRVTVQEVPTPGTFPTTPRSGSGPATPGFSTPSRTVHWWALALRGVAAIAFGVLAFLLPALALKTLVLLFAVYAITDGVLSIVSAVRQGRESRPWGALVVEGLIGIAAGVVALLWPRATALAFVLLVAAWSLAVGVMHIVAAIRLRKQIEGEWLLVLSGLLSIVLGALLIFAPLAGAVVLVWWIAAWAVVFGIVLLVLAFRVRAWAHAHEPNLRTGPRPGGGGPLHFGHAAHPR